MTSLTFYGGINEIGGNKILLEDGDDQIFFDFGVSFGTRGRYFEEYLRPRGSSGLLDYLEVGLLPSLSGLYRDDLVCGHVGRRLVRTVHPAGVFLTHAHLDHAGHISVLRPEIPVYATACTAFIAKAVQDTSRPDFEHELCYFTPRHYLCEDGMDVFHTDRKADMVRRPFSMLDGADLNEAARLFWAKRPGRRSFPDFPLGKADSVGNLTVAAFPVNHSIPGAAAMAVETKAGWVVYTGDLRSGTMTDRFVAEAARLKPKVLICEGTNVERDQQMAEAEIFPNALEFLRRAKGLVIADFGPRNVERLLTFLGLAREVGRYLVIMPKDAYLLQSLHSLDPAIPDAAADPVFRIYGKAKLNTDPWEQELRREHQGRLVAAPDIHEHQDRYILCFSLWDLNELPSIMPGGGSIYLYSSSEVFDEEGGVDMRRLWGWVEHFGMEGVGLPVEADGCWQLPTADGRLHVSGHAGGRELIDIIRRISPDIVIPVHTENARYFSSRLTGIDVYLWDSGLPLGL